MLPVRHEMLLMEKNAVGVGQEAQRSSKPVASIFLSEVKEFDMQKVKEERVKQKFEQSGKILEYSVREVGKEVGNRQEEYCQAPLMTQLWPLTFIV